MAYDKIPSSSQWISDCNKLDKGTGLFQVICNLIVMYHSAKAYGNGAQKMITIYLYYATRYWGKKAGTIYKSGPDAGAMRLPGDPAITGPVGDLHSLCAKKIRRNLDLQATDDIDKHLVEILGRPNPHQETELNQVNLVYLKSDLDRIRFKARFRSGLVFRSLSLTDDDKPIEYVPYDSEKSGESEKKDGFVHYAMDYRGRLYIGFAPGNDTKFFHSSLVGGEHVISAGTMYVQNGQILVVTNDSGHYTPRDRDLRNLLVQLQLRGVNLGPVMAKHYKTGETMAAGKLLETGKWEFSPNN